MPNFQVRVVGAFADVSGAIETVRFQMGAPDSVVYQHDDGNRTHCHVYLFGAVYKVDKLRNVCRQFFTGNRDFSCKEKAGKGQPITLEGCIRYASRDGALHCVSSTGFDPARITTLENDCRKQKVAIPARLSHYQVLLKEFDDEYPDTMAELQEAARHPDADEYAQWRFLKARMRRFAFEKNLCVWSPKCASDYKTCALTFAMRMGLRIEPNDKMYV